MKHDRCVARTSNHVGCGGVDVSDVSLWQEIARLMMEQEKKEYRKNRERENEREREKEKERERERLAMERMAMERRRQERDYRVIILNHAHLKYVLWGEIFLAACDFILYECISTVVAQPSFWEP